MNTLIYEGGGTEWMLPWVVGKMVNYKYYYLPVMPSFASFVAETLWIPSAFLSIFQTSFPPFSSSFLPALNVSPYFVLVLTPVLS